MKKETIIKNNYKTFYKYVRILLATCDSDMEFHPDF